MLPPRQFPRLATIKTEAGEAPSEFKNKRIAASEGKGTMVDARKQIKKSPNNPYSNIWKKWDKQKWGPKPPFPMIQLRIIS
ncbi:hypothetical protein D3C71_715140 [compost metagenome]